MYETKGSLTSTAKEVLFTNIQVQVLNTNSAILEVDFLVLMISGIVEWIFSLGRIGICHRSIVRHVGWLGRSVHAMCRL